MVGQCCIAIDDCLRLNGCHEMVCEVIRGLLTHSQKHIANTSHALEDLLNHEIKVIVLYFIFGSYFGSC